MTGAAATFVALLLIWAAISLVDALQRIAAALEVLADKARNP